MPNHYTAVGLMGRGNYDVELEAIKQGLDGVNLCEKVAPIPSELRGIIATCKPYRYRHKETGEFWVEDCNGPNKDGEKYERVDLTEDERNDLLSKFGAVTWYDWCTKNWGTKWGTYSLKVYKLGGDGSPILIEFQTAWGPPNPEVMAKINAWLQENFGLENQKWIGFDPYDDRTHDIKVAD